jgi:hypothetical protein
MATIELGFDVGDADRDTGSDLLPAAKYLLEVIKAEYREGQDGKSDSLWVNLKVLDAEEDSLKKYTGSKYLDIITLSEAASFRLANFLDSVYGRVVKGNKLDPDDLVGKKVVAQTKEEEYNGTIRTKTDKYMPLSRWDGDIGGETKSDKKGKESGKIGGDDEEVDL